MDIEKSIFKAYDIRGVYPEQLNEDTAYAIGRAVATIFLQENSSLNSSPEKGEARRGITLAVGGDMRVSTPSLKERLVSGLIDSGIHVVDIGLVSTPTYYYAVAAGGYDGGVQVSASHNPKEYNGFKIVRKGGVAMSGETGIQQLYDIVLRDAYAPIVDTKGMVVVKEGVVCEAVSAYIHEAGEKPIKRCKIVVDTANAMGGLDYEALFQKAYADVVWMNKELDGTFPSHEADPLKPENTKEIQARVVVERADFGIAADGDSDRIFIIDEQGQRVPSPVLYALLARSVLEQYPEATLAYEIRLGFIVEDEFASKGVKLVPTPVGHSLEKQIMLAHKAQFGGEISGHYFFKFPFGVFEAPGFAVLKLMQYLTEQNKPLSEIVKAYDRYFSSGEINTKVASRVDIEQKIALLKERYRGGKLVLLDGVKVEFPEYWFSVRASNTEPVMRLIVEAKSKELMEAKRDELLALLA